MENASKALIMAAGVLIGIMLLATYAFVIRGISIWPQAQEEMISSDQVAAFNEEFEVYKKSRMYGVDVLSCLNKAYNNNEKYDTSQEKFDTSGKKVVGKNAYNSKYVINVFVRIVDKPLEESIRIYYMDPSSKSRKEYFGTNGPMKTDTQRYKLSDTDFYPLIGDRTKYAPITTYGPNDLYTKFSINDDLVPTTNTLEGSGYLMPKGGPITRDDGDEDGPIADGTGYYSLLARNDMNLYEKAAYGRDAKTFTYDESYDGVLPRLLEYTGHSMKQLVKAPSDTPPDEWVDAVWETAVYDFKTKHFTCDYIHYNPNTGLVDQLWFSEVK